ncbi:MAG: transposase [Deltaproteobacteria bacterium]|nr:transposase [Deltaproteobacteria bacterium]
MPRRLRHAAGGYVYHVLNRAVGRFTLFPKATDYEAFVRVLAEALDWVDIRLLAYCVMPNHWHLVVWPERDGDLSEFMRWLTVTHTQRWHAKHHTQGTGPLYQGRFKAFPVEDDDHCLRVERYVERNPLRAGLTRSARKWRWSSVGRAHLDLPGPPLDVGPVARPENWLEWVDQPETEAELAALRRSVLRGVPFGTAAWQKTTSKRLGLESTLKPMGRPPKTE